MSNCGPNPNWTPPPPPPPSFASLGDVRHRSSVHEPWREKGARPFPCYSTFNRPPPSHPPNSPYGYPPLNGMYWPPPPPQQHPGQWSNPGLYSPSQPPPPPPPPAQGTHYTPPPIYSQAYPPPVPPADWPPPFGGSGGSSSSYQYPPSHPCYPPPPPPLYGWDTQSTYGSPTASTQITPVVDSKNCNMWTSSGWPYHPHSDARIKDVQPCSARSSKSRASTGRKSHAGDSHSSNLRRSRSPHARSRSRRQERSPSSRRSLRSHTRSPSRRRSRDRSDSNRSHSARTKDKERNGHHHYSRSGTRSRSRERSERCSRSSVDRFSTSSRASSTSRNAGRTYERPQERRNWLPFWKPPQFNSQKGASTTTEGEVDFEKELEQEKSMWTRWSPADLYYQRSTENPQAMLATAKLTALMDQFQYDLVDRAERARSAMENYATPKRKLKLVFPRNKEKPLFSESESESEAEKVNEDSSSDMEDSTLQELERKKRHPYRLHEELWYNDLGEMNDGPLCRCSLKARRSGIRHGIYPGEDHLPKCDPSSNNADKLFHYRITVSPHTNFLIKSPTIIVHDGHEFIFEGFSMLSHYPIGELPFCRVIRFNIEYTIFYVEERFPDHFTVRGADLFTDYLFKEILELVDLDLKSSEDSTGCSRFHFLPRFARALEDNGKELLSMNEVFQYLLTSSTPLVRGEEIPDLMKMSQEEWQKYADGVKGTIAVYPGMKPCSLRVDQLDRDVSGENKFPEIVHFGIRPLQLSYAGNPCYQKAWREYVKYRHLLANKPKVYYPDRHKLQLKEMRLQEMRTKSKLKRDVTVAVSSEGFYRTGILCDVMQHAMLLPVLISHLRFHKSLAKLEEIIRYKFQDRYLLQLALTHPSYRENFGTNPDHARNSLTNCGIRQPEYGDRRIHYLNTRKRGINTLINIMSKFGKNVETVSHIRHNERLEFLGDAVVEFLTSIHLFHLFPDIEEGGLATYRAAIVQNQHLSVLARELQLDKFMLYAHGTDLCHDLELRHAMANCFEALMGALFLDGGVDAADAVFSRTLFSDPDLLDVWVNYPLHPIQDQEPEGDRQFIESVPLLKKLKEFEEQIGVEFKHVRLLARAFTHRSVGFNNLTLGSNQRLEFLGDTVLQLVASEYLYKFFPEHHEGHLSLLRSSLVNNRTQAVVCNDLGMVDYAIYAYPKGELKVKDRADLLEAFLGALYVDKGLEYCKTFCEVCFFPRLTHFILNQDWNDPKSKLQQCCLTLRTMDGGEPDIPIYKVIECKGPTNTRIFTVAVYFRGRRLAQGSGHSIQQAEMSAAAKALAKSKTNMFPQLGYQKRVIERSLKDQINEGVDLSEAAVKTMVEAWDGNTTDGDAAT